MTSADTDVVAGMFRALDAAGHGKAGMLRLEAGSPDGIQGLRLLAIDEVVYLQHVEPALRAAKVEVVEFGRKA